MHHGLVPCWTSHGMSTSLLHFSAMIDPKLRHPVGIGRLWMVSNLRCGRGFSAILIPASPPGFHENREHVGYKNQVCQDLVLTYIPRSVNRFQRPDIGAYQWWGGGCKRPTWGGGIAHPDITQDMPRARAWLQRVASELQPPFCLCCSRFGWGAPNAPLLLP